MEPDVEAYIEAIDPTRRPLFDRLHAIVLAEHPEVEVALSYGMPAYRVGERRLNLGVWRHGVSVYGWRKDNDGGFAARHPQLSSGKGYALNTILNESEVRDVIPRLKAAGATGIVEYPLSKVVL